MVAASPQIEYSKRGLGFDLAVKSALLTTGNNGAKCSKYAFTRREIVCADRIGRFKRLCAREGSSGSASAYPVAVGGAFTRIRPFPSSDISHLLWFRRSYASDVLAGRAVWSRNDSDVGPGSVSIRYFILKFWVDIPSKRAGTSCGRPGLLVIARVSGAGSSVQSAPRNQETGRSDSPACFFFLNLVSVIGRKKVHSREYCLQCAHSASRPIASSGDKISHLIFFVLYSLAHSISCHK
jgi:hypothetical protein